jgi:Tfp pilus assembly protein PilO
MKLNYSKKILIFSLVVFLVVLILNVVFINLLLGKIVNINDKVRQLEISSTERLKEITLRDSILNSKEEREKLVTYFIPPGDTATVDFTKYLENLALENNVVQQKSLSYETLPGFDASGILWAVRYKFKVSGKWSNVYSFLRAVENLPRVSHINSVSFNLNSNNNSTKNSGTVWSVDLDFFVVKLK